jgi:predicted acylesterase/phospholipase RssA
MTEATGDKQAVVLSGGGANGAYEIGVMKALFAGNVPTITGNEPLNPGIFAGTSVGSYNAAFLVSHWDVYGTAAIGGLEQTWLDMVCSSTTKPQNGIFRIRDSPREFGNPYSYLPNPLAPLNHLVVDSAVLAWDGLQRVVNLIADQSVPLLERAAALFNFSSFVDMEPFRETVAETIWFTDLRQSSKELLIIGTNWELGQARRFKKSDMTNQLGPQIILASAAIPGFFPMQPVGAQFFVDGGVLLNTPITPVIEEFQDVDILHVISLFPDIDRIPLAHELSKQSTLAIAYRQQVIAWAKALREEINNYRDLNDRIGLVRLLLGASINLARVSPEDAFLAEEAFKTLVRNRPPAELQPLLDAMNRNPLLKKRTIHHYYPGDDISGALGLLDFDRDRIVMLIERGFEDAMAHNCEANKCVRIEDPLVLLPLQADNPSVQLHPLAQSS